MRPIVIAGPCSAESYSQLLEATTALCAMPEVQMIRAGVWKPRTRPGLFEGRGEEALRWMQQIAASPLRMADGNPVRFCCEVARPEQVELCLRYGLRTLWVGARTAGNPFMVEELCSALRGTDVDVLVKNPTSPDLALWIGAIERVRRSTEGHVSAVHRGFSMYDNQGYRNAPLWELPIELRRQLPDVPLLCDPSHMGGRREVVAELCRTAMLLAYSGLMVEVHPSPDNALTDSRQQLSPADFADLLRRGQQPNSQSFTGSHTPFLPQLETFRSAIDDIDHELLQLLSRRMSISRHIADIKRANNMTVFQQDRWQTIMADRTALAADLGLDAGFVGDILERIHAESVRVQINNAPSPTPSE